MEISRKDWKLFREKLPVWQENCMSLLIKGYITLLTTEDKCNIKGAKNETKSLLVIFNRLYNILCVRKESMRRNNRE